MAGKEALINIDARRGEETAPASTYAHRRLRHLCIDKYAYEARADDDNAGEAIGQRRARETSAAMRPVKVSRKRSS